MIKTTKTIEYLNEINLYQDDNISLNKQIENVCGTEYTNKLFTFFKDRGIKHMSNVIDYNNQFYKYKNMSLESSMAISKAFDCINVKKFCEWIENNQKLFGNKILEIGCDQGIISCFLARLFPNSYITAIDRCEEAISNAKLLAEKLGIKNINFICTDLMDFNHEPFDTVLSIRTVHENIENDSKINYLDDYQEIVKGTQNLIGNYFDKMFSLVNERGIMINIERIDVGPVLCTLFYELLNNGFALYSHKYHEIKSTEGYDYDCSYSVVIAKKNNVEYDKTQYFAKYFNFVKDKVDLTQDAWYSWESEILLSYYKKNLLYGYKVYERNNNRPIGTYQIWSLDKQTILVFEHIMEEAPMTRKIDSNFYLECKNCFDNGIKQIDDTVCIIEKMDC